jgi:hypothetical protein
MEKLPAVKLRVSKRQRVGATGSGIYKNAYGMGSLPNSKNFAHHKIICKGREMMAFGKLSSSLPLSMAVGLNEN